MLQYEGKCPNSPSTNDFTWHGEQHTSKGDNIIPQDHITDSREGNILFPNLLEISQTFATEEKYIFLLLATSGYHSLLQNFLCFATQFKSGKHILIVTPHDDIVTLAKEFDVGYYKLSTKHMIEASFGSLQYQQLVYLRTNIALELVNIGFNPIIADIDTIWKSEPLILAQEKAALSYVDVVVAPDEQEICGCFVLIKNTTNGKLFWSNVTYLHGLLISQAIEAGQLNETFESEQKILTRLLLQQQYNGTLHAAVLPWELFPSGLEYFTRKSSNISISPSIIHNNFIIGQPPKIDRFKRYNMWRVPSNHDSSADSDKCLDPSHQFSVWERVFGRVVKDLEIPTVSIILPIHNSIVKKSPERVMIQVITENIPSELSHGKIWVSNDPPRYIPFHMMSLQELMLSRGHRLLGVTVTMDSSNVTESIDLGVADSEDDSQSNILHHAASYQNIMQMNSGHNYHHLAFNNATESLCDDMKIDHITFKIKVLAYNRPESLRRLLRSLNNASYDTQQDIELEVLIDGPRTEKVSYDYPIAVLSSPMTIYSG